MTNSPTSQLQALQQGGCAVNNNNTKQVVVVDNGANNGADCCSDPTNAVLIDSSKVGNNQCAVVRWNITNTSGDAVASILRLGGGIAGMNGGYQIYDLPADASNSPIVLADGEVNVIPVQLFNNFTRNGVIITSIVIEVNGGTAPTKITQHKFTIDGQDCNSRILKGFCSVCNNNNQNQPLVVEYKRCIALDDFNMVDIPLPVNADFDVEVEYLGVGMAKGYVGCDGQLVGANIVASANK